MSDSNKLVADVRTEFGKGFARRLRAAGKIPAVVYGHGSDVKHVALPAHETGLIVRHANSIIELDIDGATELVFVKDVQREPVRSYIEHIDLVVVKRGEKIEVEVPVITEGETFSGTYLSAIVNPSTSPSRWPASRTARRSTPRTSACPRVRSSSTTPTCCS
jgi:large subunit ribosomal protein L25